jgi:hypothetical protein
MLLLFSTSFATWVGVPAYHSGFFVGASIKEYCPQHMP